MLTLLHFAIGANVTSQSIISRLLGLTSATSVVAVGLTSLDVGLKNMLGNFCRAKLQCCCWLEGRAPGWAVLPPRAVMILACPPTSRCSSCRQSGSSGFSSWLQITFMAKDLASGDLGSMVCVAGSTAGHTSLITTQISCCTEIAVDSSSTLITNLGQQSSDRELSGIVIYFVQEYYIAIEASVACMCHTQSSQVTAFACLAFPIGPMLLHIYSDGLLHLQTSYNHKL